MTIHEAIACRASGLTLEQVALQLELSLAVQAATDAALLRRAYSAPLAPLRPAYPSELIKRSVQL